MLAPACEEEHQGWHQGGGRPGSEVGEGPQDPPAAAHDRSPRTPSGRPRAGACACSAGHSGSWDPGCLLQAEKRQSSKRAGDGTALHQGRRPRTARYAAPQDWRSTQPGAAKACELRAGMMPITHRTPPLPPEGHVTFLATQGLSSPGWETLTQHEDHLLQLPLLHRQVELPRVEPQLLPPARGRRGRR